MLFYKEICVHPMILILSKLRKYGIYERRVLKYLTLRD